MDKRSKKTEDINRCRVLIIGEYNIGKTAILWRLYKKKFEEKPEKTLPPNWTDIPIKVKGFDDTVIIDIQDTNGSEESRGVVQNLYTRSQAVLLCYDMTDKRTYDDIKLYWLPQIKVNNPKIKIIGIVGTKADLKSKVQVPHSEAIQFAYENGFLFAETSSKENIGIDKLFEDISRRWLEQNGKKWKSDD